MRKIVENIYYWQGILCLILFTVGLLKHFHITPDAVTGIHMWQSFNIIGISCALLRFSDAIWLLSKAIFNSARRIAGYSFESRPENTFWRIVGLTISGAAYAVALVLPLIFISMVEQFEYIRTAP